MKKKILKRVVAWLVGIIAAMLILIAIVVNLILTPERLTPIVLGYAQEYVDGQVEIDEIEAVFFSTFPYAGVRLRNATVISNAFHKNPEDTIWHRPDTLLQVDEVRVGLNLGKYLATGDISIGRLFIDNPDIRLFVDSLGRANYDIFGAQTVEADTIAEAEEDTTTTNFSLRHIKIKNGNIAYGDRSTLTFGAVLKLNLLAKGDMNLDELSIDIEMSDSATYLAADGTRYMRALPLGLDGHIEYDMVNDRYAFDETKLSISRTELDLNGSVKVDSLNTNFDVDFGLSTPDASQIFDYLPKSLIQKEIDVSNGSVELSGSFKGNMNDEEKPVLTCNMTIDGIKAKYEGMPMGIDDLTAKFNALVDVQQPKESFVNFDIFHFQGGESEVEATVKIGELLADPLIDCKVKSHLDLGSLSEIFPVENTTMSGLVTADLVGKFRVSDLQSMNFGKLTLSGTLNIDSLCVDNDTLNFHLNNDAEIAISGSDTLNVLAAINRLRLDAPGLRVRLRNFHGNAFTELQRDTTKLALMRVSATAKRLFLVVDSTRLFFKQLEVTPVLSHSEIDQKKPYIELSLKSDSIFSNIYGTRGLTDGLDTWASLELVDTTWIPRAYANINMVRVKTPAYNLPFEMTDTRITMEDRLIDIEKAKFRVGHSSGQLSGTIKNLYQALSQGRRMRTNITLAADTLHLTELASAIVEEDERELAKAQASNESENDSTLTVTISNAVDTITVDSIPPRIFAIPPKIRMGFNFSANRLIWNKLELEDVKTTVEIRRQALHMTNLMFRRGDAHPLMTVAYKARPEDNMADIKCFAVWAGVDIQDLVHTLDLDTVMPILEPIKGVVDAHFAAELEIDSLWNFDLNTTRAAVHLSAKQLVVLDGENLAKISKTLMFKNKEENVIDTVSMNVVLDSAKLELLPFVAQIDRYRLVIGGEQDLENNLKYHVSIIKSPLPFKAGVTITGTPDDIDVDITTAKLKKYDSTEKQLENDTVTFKIRNDILYNSYLLSGLDIPEPIKNMPRP